MKEITSEFYKMMGTVKWNKFYASNELLFYIVDYFVDISIAASGRKWLLNKTCTVFTASDYNIHTGRKAVEK